MKEKMINFLYCKIYPPLLYGFIKAITSTLKIKIIGKEHYDRLRKTNQRILIVFWHGRLFLMISVLQAPNHAVVVSSSRDGMLIAHVLERFHYHRIWGSSDRSPVKVLLSGLDHIKKGFNIGFTVDGPKGPIHKVKPGALYLAQKSDAWILPVSFSAKPAFIFHSWDRFLLPFPFAKAVFVFGKPFKPSEDILHESLYLEQILNQLTQEADKIVGLETKD